MKFTPVAPLTAARTPSKRRLLRFITSPSGTTLDFKKLKKDAKIDTKKHFLDICVMVINSKRKSWMICCLLNSGCLGRIVLK